VVALSCGQKQRVAITPSLPRPGGASTGAGRLADANCDAAHIHVRVPEYTEQVGFELEQIQAHALFFLIDNVTGYRSRYQEEAFVIEGFFAWQFIES